jgi:adenylate cyclase
MMQSLRSEGITNYVAFRIRFANGSSHGASFATDAPDGFSDHDIELLLGLERLLALRLENTVRRELASTVLGAYLGKDAAKRVLEGRIRRGDIETISAAIWMSDLRGFTTLSDRLSAEDLLELLGDYFTIVVTAVRSEGGEVLKFIGDAVLAIFRVGDRSSSEACDAAARAARAVEAALVERNSERQQMGKALIRHGVGLHVGEVNYGNVGSADRLDFTVIGPAVNMVARVESLCGLLKQQVLISEAFAQQVSVPTKCLGPYELKGLQKAVLIYEISDLVRPV